MPEGPEVALCAEILSKYFQDKRLDSFDFLAGRFKRKPPLGYRAFRRALPARVLEIDSKGKFMWFKLKSLATNKIWWIWNTFGLTGIWSFELNPYIKARLRFGTKPSVVYFSDVRNFGTIKFSNSEDAFNHKIAKIAPDFLKSDNFNIRKVHKYSQPIVKILMDQTKVGSGIGNYLAAEILYRAKISPWREGKSLTIPELARLDYWIRYTIKLAYTHNSTGYMIYLEPEASKIRRHDYHSNIKLHNRKFQFKVYRRKFDPKGNPVKADHIVGSTKSKRRTYWVPKVQK